MITTPPQWISVAASSVFGDLECFTRVKVDGPGRHHPSFGGGWSVSEPRESVAYDSTGRDVLSITEDLDKDPGQSIHRYPCAQPE